MIREYREQRGFSQQEFAKKMNVSQATVSDWEKGVSIPRSKRLQSIAQVLNVEVDSLLSAVVYNDSGSNFPVVKEPTPRYKGNTRSVKENIRELYVELPFASLRAQAGIPESYEGCQLDWISETYPVYFKNLAKKKQLVIEIDGESMSPGIVDGAHVLGQSVPKDDIKYESGGVYAVLFGNGRFVVKRIKTNEINTAGILTLWSDNETYGRIEVPANEIHCMWKIVGKVWEPMR